MSGTVDSGPAAERLRELLGYVEQVIRLDERPAFRLAEFRLPSGQTFVFYQLNYMRPRGDLADDAHPLLNGLSRASDLRRAGSWSLG